MFYNIGNLGSHIKMMEQKLDYQQKKKDPAALAAKSYGETGKAQGLSALLPEPKSPESGALEQKLSTGKKLTQAEMNYLRDNDPALYAKAQRIETERRFYEKALRQCLTKDQVRGMRMSKLASLVSDVKDAVKRGDGEACAEIHQRQAAMATEHGRFLKTREYARLPQNHHELAARRKLRYKVIRTQRKTFPAEAFFYDQSAQKQAIATATGQQVSIQVSAQKPASATSQQQGEGQRQQAARRSKPGRQA